ncbi:MAG: DNA (cytosine-5-)-methyltransferase [Ekhidna sp.]
MRHGSLFSGIGGFDLPAEWMGWENVFHCEWNEFGQQLLKYYWPNTISYDDIRKTDFTIHRGKIDILTGGFPCQPYSVAGARKGAKDNRHLWPEVLRAIREVQPRFFLGENVPGIINWSKGLVFKQVQTDLEDERYKVQPIVLPACAIGADHIRERVWFFAYSDRLGWPNVQSDLRGCSKEMENSKRVGKKREWAQEKTNELDSSCNTFLRFQKMYGQPSIFDVDDGLPFKLDGIAVSTWIRESFKAVGNAVDPRLVFQIFQIIEKLNQRIKPESNY